MKKLFVAPVARTRQNHALEHATISILTARHPQLRVGGHSSSAGFRVFGNVDTAELRSAAEEGLRRLQAGEEGLAVHPHCGTNLVSFAVLSFILPFTMAGRTGSAGTRLSRGLLGLAAAGLVSPSVGRLAQKYVTTSPDEQGRRIKSIKRSQFWGRTVHVVEVE